MLVLTKLKNYNIDKRSLCTILINKHIIGYHIRKDSSGKKIIYSALLYAWVLNFDNAYGFTNVELKRTMHKNIYSLQFIETYKNNIYAYSNLSINNAIANIVITLKKQVLASNFIKYTNF